MPQFNSRLEKKIEKQSKRQAILVFLATIGLFIALLFVGLPALFALTNFVSALARPSTKVIVQKIKPTTPRFNQEILATSGATFVLSGVADPKATIEISQKGQSLGTVVTNDDGSFSIETDLEKGENIFLAQAVLENGTKSDSSQAYVLRRLFGKPKLEVEKPTDGETVKDNPTEIKGKTDPGNTISINDRLAITDSSGTFSYLLNLTGGENKLTIVSKDPAGNTTNKELTIKFSP